MPIKKRSVIKAFTRAPMPASCAFCFAKFTPFLLCFFGRMFWIFERQIRLLPPKFMRLYFVVEFYFYALSLRCGKFTASFCASAACAVLSSRSCLAHKRSFGCGRINLFSRCGAIFMGTATLVCFSLRGRLRRSVISAQHVFARPACA